MIAVRRLALRAAVLALATGAGMLTPASTPAAEAATTPYCNTTRNVTPDWATHITIELPAHTTAGLNCHLAREGRPASYAVEVLQMSLMSCYGANIVADGLYGPKTEAAVRRAQQMAHFPASQIDGKAGPYTISHLMWRTSYGHGTCGPLH